ncbi:MAG: nitrate/nitrite transporter [Alphaproteobacteria bacterium]
MTDPARAPTAAPMPGEAGAGGRLSLLVLLIAVTCLSQFYRVSNGVIAPELTAELGLGPQQLAWAGGAFFVTLLALQIPVGIWFDRYGGRVTVSALSLVAVVGAVLIARADSATSLIVARAVVGIGCAASFMCVVFLCSRWFPKDRLTTVLSWVFAASNIGTLAAGTPLAWAAARIGWRNGFLAVGAVTLAVAALFFLLVRDRPPGMPAPPRARDRRESFTGFVEVLRTRGLWSVLALHTFAYATMLTVLGIWAGPYLHDVHGLGAVARGNVMTLMGTAQIVGILCYGPMDRFVRSRKRIAIAGALLTVAALLALASLRQPPLWLAVALLVLFTFLAAYPIQIVAQGRALFPDRLAGRGVTTVNMAQLVGMVLLSVTSGAIVAAFAPVEGLAPEWAYRAVFLSLAGGLVLGLVFYRRSPDDVAAR